MIKERRGVRRLLYYLSTPKCICCKEPLPVDRFAFCRECSLEFGENLKRNCSVCGKSLIECNCSSEFLSAHFVGELYKCFRYIGSNRNRASSSLIYHLKHRSRYDAVEFAAELLIKAFKPKDHTAKEFIFTNVPRRRGAIIQYGIDHSRLLAKALAKKLGAKYMPLLRSRARGEQKHLSRVERMQNANFRIKGNISLRNKRVVIVDDIVTTGASMGCAASLIRSLGAKDIRGLCLAVSFGDEYLK